MSLKNGKSLHEVTSLAKNKPFNLQSSANMGQFSSSGLSESWSSSSPESSTKTGGLFTFDTLCSDTGRRNSTPHFRVEPADFRGGFIEDSQSSMSLDGTENTSRSSSSFCSTHSSKNSSVHDLTGRLDWEHLVENEFRREIGKMNDQE